MKLNNYLVDMKYVPIFRHVRDSYLSDQNRPASTTLAISGLAREGALLEVEAIAVRAQPPSKQAQLGRKLRVQDAPTRTE